MLCKPQTKKVAQINKDTNEIIQIYNSLTEASIGFNKGNIGKCCNNKLHYNTAYGYKWKYIQEVMPAMKKVFTTGTF